MAAAVGNQAVGNQVVENQTVGNREASPTAADTPPPWDAATGKTVVIGCGNLLRGDDAVGPILVRHLWERGVGDDVVLVDGGTAGMDVAFKMRGARRVVIVDASSTGSEPGTVFEVPASELADVAEVEKYHSHAFRWDHALAFAHWLLGDDYPSDITVFLVEAADVSFGAELTPAVAASMERVIGYVEAIDGDRDRDGSDRG
ncbi:MAG: hydrogenase maturation protease [Actinomycetota bacterium]|nr:hydrogenase maturation protease [Actinomycetota bacterium]